MPSRTSPAHLFWRSVNYFRGLPTRAKSLSTSPWGLVKLYFKESQGTENIRGLILQNLGQRIREGQLSVKAAESIPPIMLKQALKASGYDPLFMARIVIEGRSGRIGRLVYNVINNHPELQPVVAKVLLEQPCSSDRIMLKKKLFRAIAKNPDLPAKQVAQIINIVTEKSLQRLVKVKTVVGSRALSPNEEAAIGRDPTKGPSMYEDEIADQTVIVRHYSVDDLNSALRILSKHPQENKETILDELEKVNQELAKLLRRRYLIA